MRSYGPISRPFGTSAFACPLVISLAGPGAISAVIALVVYRARALIYAVIVIRRSFGSRVRPVVLALLSSLPVHYLLNSRRGQWLPSPLRRRTLRRRRQPPRGLLLGNVSLRSLRRARRSPRRLLGRRLGGSKASGASSTKLGLGKRGVAATPRIS